MEYCALRRDEAELAAKEAAGTRNVDALRRPMPIPEGAVGWIEHCAHLERLADAGCVFGVNDLTADEWRGRDLLRAAREKFSRDYRACEKCGASIPRWSSQGCRCGG